MNIKIKLNPEYAKLVLPLSEGEYQELKQSIKQNGLWHPITVNKKDTVLDGHHRYKVCEELGIQPKIEYKSFGSVLQEKLFVIDSNLKRRQLSTFARVELALSKKPILQEIARNNMALAGKGDIDDKVQIENQDAGVGYFDYIDHSIENPYEDGWD